MSRVRQLARTTDLTRFERDFFDQAEAVVVEGAAKVMPAYERWSDAYLLHALGDARPTIRLSDGRLAQMPAEQFFAYLASPQTFATSYGPLYLTDYYVSPNFGDRGRSILEHDADCPLPRTGRYAEWISMYAGPPGTSTKLHQDRFGTHTWLAELRGTKTWRLCAPTGLAPAATGSVDIFEDPPPDCDVYEAILEPGDVIYLPPNWWHQVFNGSSSTLALSGNFCTFAHAHESLAMSEAFQDEQLRDVWVRTWKAILERE